VCPSGEAEDVFEKTKPTADVALVNSLIGLITWNNMEAGLVTRWRLGSG
jgi:hypothetical protein